MNCYTDIFSTALRLSFAGYKISYFFLVGWYGALLAFHCGTISSYDAICTRNTTTFIISGMPCISNTSVMVAVMHFYPNKTQPFVDIRLYNESTKDDPIIRIGELIETCF